YGCLVVSPREPHTGNAIKIGELITELSHSLEEHKDTTEVAGLLERFTDEIRGKSRKRSKESCLARLLYPEQDHRNAEDFAHSHEFHVRSVSDVALIDSSYAQERRRKIGWLAHFNAACFFSLAIGLREDQLPNDFGSNLQDWKDDCARAAIFEL